MNNQLTAKIVFQLALARQGVVELIVLSLSVGTNPYIPVNRSVSIINIPSNYLQRPI